MTGPVAAQSSASSISYIQNRLNGIEDGKSSESSQQRSSVLSPQDIVDIKSSMAERAAIAEKNLAENEKQAAESAAEVQATFAREATKMAERQQEYLAKIQAADPVSAITFEGDDAEEIMGLLEKLGVDSYGASSFTTFIDDLKYSVDGDTVKVQNRYAATNEAEKAQWIQDIENSLSDLNAYIYPTNNLDIEA